MRNIEMTYHSVWEEASIHGQAHFHGIQQQRQAWVCAVTRNLFPAAVASVDSDIS